MIHCACVCVGDAFGPEYVRNLYLGIKRNIDCLENKWDFTVISDRSFNPLFSADNMRHVHHGMDIPPSWWMKLALFRDDIWPYGETVFFMDLDTIIVGDLGKLASRKGFNMLNWNGPYYPYGSGVMIFPAGIKPEIWEVWKGASEETLNREFPKGDQQLIAESFEGEINPIGNDEVASYKRDFHVYKGERWKPDMSTKGTESVVAFHGKPRPHEITKGYWAYHEWRRL